MEKIWGWRNKQTAYEVSRIWALLMQNRHECTQASSKTSRILDLTKNVRIIHGYIESDRNASKTVQQLSSKDHSMKWGDTISSREIWKMLLHSDHGWEYFIFFLGTVTNTLTKMAWRRRAYLGLQRSSCHSW